MKEIYICQEKYALDIISETGMLGAKSASFPLKQNHNLAMSTSPLLSGRIDTGDCIGRLIYLAVSRPDLAYLVHILPLFMQLPREDH